ncbi:MAG: diguanylate cyclase, partial [Planctomycetota bacterium]|nr:diguanylate cyclase [Planctomycetota bacterium]
MTDSTHENCGVPVGGVQCHSVASNDVNDSACVDARLVTLRQELVRVHEKLSLSVRSHATILNEVESDTTDGIASLLGTIDGSIDILRQRLARAETRIHEQDLQIAARSSESQTDGLTGLRNRRSFDQEFGDRRQSAENSRCPLILVLIDIDHFKAVNDTRGHHVGDAVLRGLAKLVSELVPPEASVARYGGEEFAVLLSSVYADHAIELVERIRAEVGGTKFRHSGQGLAITISCGLAQFDGHEHREQLLQRADLALYAAKQAGRNRCFWHDGQDVHLATSGGQLGSQVPSSGGGELVCRTVDLDGSAERSASTSSDSGRQSASLTIPRATRVNWCDGSMLFWYLRQRLAERKRGGDPLCLLAIDVDRAQHIVQSYGMGALHFMMRAQMLHLDATLRDMDVVARTYQSRIIVVLPRMTLTHLTPMLRRLQANMNRFAYPTASEILDYSISIGVAEAGEHDDPQKLVLRGESALAAAQ